nr:kinesin-like protein KIN-14N [Ipomoea trifida]GLL35514.1 kinesin-like protein KIN-14N [Ipomoea trifida]
MLMKSKEEELNAIIMELRKNIAVLQDNLKEESEKSEALNSLSREKETQQASLSEEHKRAQEDLTTANLYHF